MSGCFYGPFISDDQPVNCAYEVYERETIGTAEAPVASVVRNNQSVDVTGTIEDRLQRVRFSESARRPRPLRSEPASAFYVPG